MLKNTQNPTAAVKNLSGLASLRGIAALMVVMHHFTLLIFPSIGKTGATPLFVKSYLFVDMFFILSGYVMYHVYKSHFLNKLTAFQYRNFMTARFARIYPLHIFTLLIFVLLELLYLLLFNLLESPNSLITPFTDSRALKPLLINIFMLQGLSNSTFWNQPAWTISTEFIIYFIVPFMLLFLIKLPKTLIVIGCAAAIITLLVIENMTGDLDRAGVVGLIRCFSGSLIGMSLCLANEQKIAPKLFHYRWCLPIFSMGLLSLTLSIPHIVTIILFAWLIGCTANIPEQQATWLTHHNLVTLGTLSYSIYMLHWFWYYFATTFFRALNNGTPLHESLSLWQQWLAIATFVAILIGLSKICYQKIESPCRRALKHYLHKQ